jgi:hypothetical protein
MGIQRVARCTPRGPLTHNEAKASSQTGVLFVSVILSVLREKLVDDYCTSEIGRTVGCTGVSDMDQFNNYMMLENRFVVG